MPMVMNTIVMAVDMPVRDQPVASDMGCRNTASEKVVPMATQPIKAPAATTTQPYWYFMSALLGWGRHLTYQLTIGNPIRK